MSQAHDLTGKRFGRLNVLRREDKNNRTAWRCVCDCGEETVVATYKLTGGNTISCGCKRAENKIKHGKSPHGNRHRLYRIWGNMKQRCFNPKNTAYENYGGKGISVCCEWSDNFQTFYDWAIANGYDDNCQIDRINSNGDYAPSNCRWVSPQQNLSNTKRNVLITHNGETHTAAEWSRITGISEKTIGRRAKAGKSSAEILDIK